MEARHGLNKEDFQGPRKKNKKNTLVVIYSLLKITWTNDLWMDETKTVPFGLNEKRCVLEKEKKKTLQPKNFVPSVKHGDGSNLAWACFTLSCYYTSEFERKMSGHLNLKRIASCSKPTSLSTKEWLKKNKVHVQVLTLIQ